MNFDAVKIDSSWTLFLDRDGVINERMHEDYVKDVEGFRFLPGVLNALKVFADMFGKIIVVTNQQGIGKGVMNESDLELIHNYLLDKVNSYGGRINKIYYSPSLAEENDISRKPKPGLALQAKNDFPDIDFKKSIMIGDSMSDMEFGKNLNMICVFISRDKQTSSSMKGLFDISFENLFEFSQYLCR